MHRLGALIVILSLLLGSVPVMAGGSKPQIEAKGAALVDVETGRLLWAYNPDLPLPPASTTKIMTILLGLELGQPEHITVVSKLAQSQAGSRVFLGEGEKYTRRELLYAVLLASANDAAVVIAEDTAGSVEKFVEIMNERARKLGAKNTNFVNPNGLPDPEHVTTAYDLALIARCALQNPTFREMAATKTYPMSWPGHEEERQLVNNNKLLSNYEGADGVKTGYTIEAGSCFVGSATREGRQLVAVVLGTTSRALWSDAKALLDYGFENYNNEVIVKKEIEITTVPVKHGRDVGLLTGENFVYSLAAGEREQITTQVKLMPVLTAPLAAGEEVGSLEVYLGTEKLTELPLVTGQRVYRKPYSYWWFWPLAFYVPWRIRVAIRRLRRRRRYHR